jgi:putative transposase
MTQSTQAAEADNNTTNKVFEYKLRTNKSFVAAADNILWRCRELYNACLEQRISHYLYTGKSPNWIEQGRQLTELRADDPAHSAIPRRIQGNVIDRIENTYQAFFRRCKSGETPGFPRFKGPDRYNSFEYSVDLRCRHISPLKGDKLRVLGIGTVRVRLSRELPEGAKIKIVRIIRKADGWYTQLVCEVIKPSPLPKTGKTVGVDVGLTTFAALSTGEMIDNPRTLRASEDSLANAGRVVSRRKKNSKRRRKARTLLAKHHLRVSRARKHFHYQVANRLVREFDEIHVEQLNIRGMVKNRHLAKSISDVAWSSFFLITNHKAEWAGRLFIKKIARYTSQDCNLCGHRQKMPLAIRIFTCGNCGNVEHRDTNASLNILQAESACQLKETENVKRRKPSASVTARI